MVAACDGRTGWHCLGSTAAWGSVAKRVQASNEPSKFEIRSRGLGFSLHCFCLSNADFSPVHRVFQVAVHGLALLRVRET